MTYDENDRYLWTVSDLNLVDAPEVLQFNPAHDKGGKFASKRGGAVVASPPSAQTAPSPSASLPQFRSKSEAERYCIDNNLAAHVDFTAAPSMSAIRSVVGALQDCMTNSGMPPVNVFGFQRDFNSKCGGADEIWIGDETPTIIDKYALKKRADMLGSMIQSGQIPSTKMAAANEQVQTWKDQLAAVQRGDHSYYKEHSIFAFEDVFDGVVRHEFGHRWTEFHSQTLQMMFNTVPPTVLFKKVAVTTRSKDSIHEAMAENFALYSAGKTTSIDPMMINMFRATTSWKY